LLIERIGRGADLRRERKPRLFEPGRRHLDLADLRASRWLCDERRAAAGRQDNEVGLLDLGRGLALALQVANSDARGNRDFRDRAFELAGEGGAECAGLICVGANVEVGR